VILNVAEMLGNLVKFVNGNCIIEVIEVGNIFFEFLIEVIQGPCIEN
jgi:hypothetical protein